MCFLTAGALLAVTTVVTATPGGAQLQPRAVSFQYGINSYVTYNCLGAPTMDKWATTEVSQYKALGANSIGLSFPLYTDSMTSNNIYGRLVCNNIKYQTPPPGILAGIVQIAHAAGLKVFLRPLLDQSNLQEQNPKNWRGIIEPTNLRTWFSNYLNALRPYLEMAQSNHVEHVAIETELDSLSKASNWSAAISFTRAIYKGDLVWNYSWFARVPKARRAGTSFGIDTYPALPTAKPTATPLQLATKWAGLLKQTDYKVPQLRTTTIDEIDIPAQRGAYAFPFATSLSLKKYPFNQTIQANWFAAACSFMKQHHMKGIYYWGPWLGNDDGSMLINPDAKRPTDIQPASKVAISHCFS